MLTPQLPPMISSIAYILFSALGITLLTGLVIIIRNSIKITGTYKFFKNKLKPKSRIPVTKINSVKLPVPIPKTILL